MTETIKQRTDGDCGLCAMAMALGETYDDFIARIGPVAALVAKQHGTTLLFECAALEVYGLVDHKDYLVLRPEPEFVQTGFLRNLLFGRRAIISARSRNHWNGQHAVFWDGETLHDPSNAKQWSWDHIEPILLILFNER